MAFELFQTIYDRELLTSPISSLVEVIAPSNGTITVFDIWALNAVNTTDSLLNLAINGVKKFSGAGRPVISAANQTAQETGLTIPVVKGDVISFDVDVVGIGGLNIPIFFQVSIDDGNALGIVGATNIGGENNVFKAITANKLDLRTLKAGANVTITENENDIEIEASGGGSLAGDVSGAVGENTVDKIQARPIAVTAPPAPLGDDFEDGVLSTSLWDIGGDSNSILSATETGGLLKFLAVNNSFASGRFILTDNAYDFNEKALEFDIESFTLPDTFTNDPQFKFFLGVVDQATTTYGSSSGQGTPANFIGFLLQGSGSNAAKTIDLDIIFVEPGNTNNLTGTSISSETYPNAGFPTKLRIRDVSGSLHFEGFISEAWVSLFIHDYNATTGTLTDKKFIVSLNMGRRSKNPDYQLNLNSVISTILPSDALAVDSMIIWNGSSWVDISLPALKVKIDALP